MLFPSSHKGIHCTLDIHAMFLSSFFFVYNFVCEYHSSSKREGLSMWLVLTKIVVGVDD